MTNASRELKLYPEVSTLYVTSANTDIETES